MSSRLAIYSYNLGKVSETFVKRHIDDLCPGRTVIITNNIMSGDSPSWACDCPIHQIPKPSGFLSEQIARVSEKWKFDWCENVGFDGVKAFLAEHEVDVILGQYLHRSWPLIKIANDLGIKLFAHAHGYDLSEHYLDPVWRRRYVDYKAASGLIVVNKVMQQRLVSLGIAEEKIHIIPYGVDVPDAPPERLAGTKINCLAVGRFMGKKAPLKLLGAFLEACNTNSSLHLDYIGEGRLLSEAKAFVENHDLSRHVTLHGAKEHEFVIKKMKQAEIFIQHSVVDPITGDEEGVPVAILEAMAMGLPVVSTRHAGIPEAVEEDCTGYLVDEGDVEEMGAKILQLAGDIQLRNRMGHAGWLRAKKLFTWDREKERLLDVLGLGG